MAAKKFEERFQSGSARRVARRVDEVFTSLERIPFLRKEDRSEFRYFRRLFLSACKAIDKRIGTGEIRPWTKAEIDILTGSAQAHFPQPSPRGKAAPHKAMSYQAPHCHLLSRRSIRLGVFIGSFDPFQMTHLETALRFLAKGQRPADLVLVIPEGAYTSLKPGRSDYAYRFDILQRQVTEAFRPFIVPLDIGSAQDTIGIVNRIIGLSTGYPLTLTHILGSDVFPLAAKWYRADLDAWEPEARKRQVGFDFGTFVVQRKKEDRISDLVKATRRMGVPVQVDPKPIGTPSSSEVREQGVFTIVFPTEEVIEKLEVVFRYGMHRHWLTEKGGAEYDI